MTFTEDIPSFRLDIDKLSDKEKQTIKEKFAVSLTSDRRLAGSSLDLGSDCQRRECHPYYSD